MYVNLDRVSVRNAINVNISPHGGGAAGPVLRSDCPDRRRQMDVNFDLRYAFGATLERQLSEHPDEHAVVKLIGQMMGRRAGRRREPIDVFGGAGEAKPLTHGT